MALGEKKTGFQGMGGLMPFKVERKEIGWETCEGCGRRVLIVEDIPDFGPNKGQPVQSKLYCDCEALEIFRQQQERAREEIRQRKKESAIRLFNEKSTINTNLKAASFDNYNPTCNDLATAKLRAFEYAEQFDPKESGSLIFVGPWGTGKSHLSVSIAKAVMEKGYSALFVTVQKLLTMIKQTFDRGSDEKESDLLIALEAVDLLVLDDIGQEKLTEWSSPKLFEILDSRQGKANIFTTNSNPTDLGEKIGGQSVSRMQYTEKRTVLMFGPDYRMR